MTTKREWLLGLFEKKTPEQPKDIEREVRNSADILSLVNEIDTPIESIASILDASGKGINGIIKLLDEADQLKMNPEIKSEHDKLYMEEMAKMPEGKIPSPKTWLTLYQTASENVARRNSEPSGLK